LSDIGEKKHLVIESINQFAKQKSGIYNNCDTKTHKGESKWLERT